MRAFERAKALHQHAKYCGAPLEEFVLELTDTEAFEALDWLANDPENAPYINQELLAMDVAVAKASKTPWELMNSFQIMGLTVTRRQGELH